jgi:hypothetical protein
VIYSAAMRGASERYKNKIGDGESHCTARPNPQSLIEVLGWSSRGGAPLAAEEKKRKEFERNG